MSSAPTQLAVAPTASALVTSTAQIQKDFLEEPLARQNSLGNRARGSAKPKHLQRSHAMRESTSPPRTPTPRSDHLATSPVSAYSSTETINDSKMHVQSSSLSTSPSLETSVMVSSQHPQQQTHSSVVMYSTNENNTNCGVVCNQSQLDVDFPKLTPPKSSKCSRNANSNRDLGDKSSNTSENNKQAFNTSPNGMNNTDSVQAINISNGKKNNESMKSNGQTNINNNNNHNNNAPLIANNNQAALTPSSHQNRMHHQSPPNEHCGNNNAQSTMMVNNCNQQMSPCPVMSSYDKENHCPRNDSQNTNSSSYTQEDNQNSMSESPTDTTPKGGDRLGKKHRSGANSKGSKPRLKNMGSSSSMDGGNSTSGFISRDSSMEQFTDQSGVDLLQFFKETLNKNPIDRTMLMKIEKELIDLAHDKTTREIKFPAASSYNRMLIHRVAAFFGMEHNVDNATQQCVIVATTKSTRIPDIRFKSLCRERLSDEPRKSILKRDAHSFDDPRQSFLICPERGVLDRKSKSFEEREEEYEKARRRIFRPRDGGEMGCEDSSYWLWSSSDSSDQSARFRQNNKLLKVQSLSVDSRSDGRPSVSKSHSFGGYGGPPSCGPLARGDSINSTKSAGPRLFSKQDSVGSTNTPWRLSPSSSGYKTQTQSLRSDSVTPSPTGYGSDDHTPEPSLAQSPPIATCGIVWAVTDMASVPRGSVLINPQTLQPIVNQDGSIYHFDPSNLPPSQAVAPGMMYSKNLGTTIMHRKKVDSKKSSKSEASLTDSCSGPTTTTESSIETLSESSAQTVLNAGSREDSEETIDIAKENHIRREMGDIQEESVNNSLDESDKPPTNSDEIVEIEQKPKLKNQATSPNIPFTEPNEQITQAHEAETNNGTTESTETQNNNNNNTINIASSTPDCTEDKKEESKNTSSNIPVMSYATGFQPVDGNTVFPPPGGGPYPTTTYQSAPDGSVYAVPQPMVYAYPPPMEGEIQGYFMPVYEQTGQRDTNGLVPAPAQAIYQPAGGAAAVVPVAYPTAPFSGAPIYPSQVVYSPDQFAQSASTAGQVQQYQMTYPVGYPYTYNGYWGQTMTYYVPQPPLGNTVPPGLIPPPLPPSGTTTSIGSHGSSNCSSGKRSSPPQQSLSSGPNSQTATPANTYQFAPGVPLTLTSDPNGPTMYAIPQPAVFPNMLPYGPQSTPSATSGVLTSVPPHQPNAVISPLISHQTGPAGPHIQMDPSSTVYNVTNTNGNHANSNGTPQSGSGTPLSNPLPLPHPQRNQPLFATPPIIPNGYNAPLQNHYQSYTDSQNIGNSHYEKKNSMNSGNKKGNGGYIPNGRQNSYAGNQQRKPTADNSNIPTNQNGTNRQMHMTQQQKRGNDNKNQSSGGGGGGIVNSNTMGGNNAQNNSDKQPRTGVRPKPGNLDLRRSASQRNSPSTNSLESNNNSPNSIASNHLTGGYSADHPQSMYMTRGTHIPPMHPPTAAAVVAAAAAAANDAAACHQPLIGAYNHPAPAGMYIKYGQAYFTHPPVALPNNRRSPPNELRPPLTPLTGMYSTVNMMLPAPRQMQPRHPNPNYKGNKPSR